MNVSKLAASPKPGAGPQVCLCDTNGIDKKLNHKCVISVLSIFTDFRGRMTSHKAVCCTPLVNNENFTMLNKQIVPLFSLKPSLFLASWVVSSLTWNIKTA